MMQNTELLTIVDGGIQTVIPELATMSPQIIYLDFDGELTSYHNHDLDIHIDDVAVEDSGLTQERIVSIVKALNDDFAAQNVIFVTERPTDTEFSTIYVGKTSSFDGYGNFAGLAETVDIDNKIKNDNAFVMLDDATDNSTIIETISHEAWHLIGTLEHGGDGIGRYTEDVEEDGYIYYYYLNNQTFTGELNDYLILSKSSTGKTIAYSSYRSIGGNVSSCIGTRYVSADNVIINSGDRMYVSNGGIAIVTTVNSGGWIDVRSGGTASVTTVNSESDMHIVNGGTVTATTVNSDGHMRVYSGGTADATTVNSGGFMDVFSGGTADATTVNSGGCMRVSSGGTAYGITVSSGGSLSIYVAPGTYAELTSDGSAFEIKGAFISEFTINSGVSIDVVGGGTANNTIVNSSGYIFVSSGGIANNTTVNSRGYMSVLSGGIVNNTIVQRQTCLYLGLHVFYNGLANDTTINADGLMYVYGGTAKATMVNGGWFYISSGGMGDNTTVNSGGRMYVFCEGTANSNTVNSGGRLYISSGGTANSVIINSAGSVVVSSGGILEGEILLGGKLTTGGAVIATDAEIVFDLTQRLPEDTDVMVDNLANLSGASYCISVLSNQNEGMYRLANGTDGFHDNITLTIEGTDENSTFTWQEDKYNTISFNGKRYILDNSNDRLSLKIGPDVPPKITFDFSIDKINQIEYYSYMTLKVPYVATATITVDKYAPNGTYSFVSFLEDYNGAKRHFQIEINNGIPKFSDYTAVKVSENDENITWRFSGIEDYIMTEKADSNMPIGIRYYKEDIDPASALRIGTISVGDVQLEVNVLDSTVVTVKQGDCDANKKGYYLTGTFIYDNGFTIAISPYDSNKDYVYDKYLVTIESPDINYSFSKQINLFAYTSALEKIQFSISTIFELGYNIAVAFNKKNDGKYESLLYKNGIQIAKTQSLKKTQSLNDGDYDEVFALKQDNHCWIATAANMLYKGGYLPKGYSAQKCFEDLSDYYFKKHKMVSKGDHEREIFKSLGLSCQYKEYDDNHIYEALQSLYNKKIGVVIVAAISFESHVMTCFSVTSLSEKKAIIRYADSDIDIDMEHVAEAELQCKDGYWSIFFEEYDENRNEKWYKITSITTLIGRTDGTPTLDVQKFIRGSISGSVSARQYSNVNTNGLNTTVLGSITDAIVESEGILQIASGATAETLNIHDNAAVIFDSDSKATGKIMTYGGNISVSAGADVSDAEIDFNLTNLTAGNTSMLDNLQNAFDAAFMVTVGSDQATGRYLLADGATGYNGNVKVYGETYGDYFVRPGFVDGELGIFAVGETLEVAKQLYTLSVEDDTLTFTVAWVSLSVLSVSSDSEGYLTEQPVTVTAVFSDDIVHPEYSFDGEKWEEYNGGVTVTENGFVWFRGTDADGNQSEIVKHEVYNIIHSYSIDGGDANGISLPESTSQRLLVFSKDGYNHSLEVIVETDRVNLHGLPIGTYSWKVRDIDDVEWSYGNDVTVETHPESQLFVAEENGNMNAFFVNPLDAWNGNYQAMHTGIGAWGGTNEIVELDGKNQILDVFAGSDGASILLMTDDENGDALFIDDIYSAFPEGLDAQARLAKIDEIRAGAGNDIVDLTSQRFDYIGGGLTVHGGLGDDVIWANNGDNTLFGDAGNDRIVGAGGNDVIVGGAGDDSMHGGGGEDIFAFGSNWGNDSVEQLSDGKVTLWFENGSLEKWDASTLTYTDGENRVIVNGVTAENISLKFGDDGSEQYGKLLESGAFDEFSSERIFENKNTRGMLA